MGEEFVFTRQPLLTAGEERRRRGIWRRARHDGEGARLAGLDYKSWVYWLETRGLARRPHTTDLSAVEEARRRRAYGRAEDLSSFARGLGISRTAARHWCVSRGLALPGK